MTYTLLSMVHIWNYVGSDVSWLRYLCVSLLSGSGDCMAIYSYNEMSLSSAMILCTTAFWSPRSAFFFVKRKISIVQIFSLFLGFSGVVLVCVADGLGSSQWVGNVLALASAVAYAIANVVQEVLLRTATVTTFCVCAQLASRRSTSFSAGRLSGKRSHNIIGMQKHRILP
jgi:drug/metabolite transporter (DMT)-like permease